MKSHVSEEPKALLNESEAFAKLVNRMIEVDKEESFYDHPEFKDTTLSCNTTFSNQDSMYAITVTPLTWLLGCNPQKKIYVHGISLLLQHPELIFKTFCNLNLYTFPIISGEVELIKELQGHGLSFETKHLTDFFNFLIDPMITAHRDKMIPALQQALKKIAEVTDFSAWIKPLIKAMEIENGEIFVELVIKEMRIFLKKKLRENSTAEKINQVILQSIDKEIESKESELYGKIKSLLNDRLITYFEKFIKQKFNSIIKVDDLSDCMHKKSLLKTGFHTLDQKEPTTPLSFATSQDDIELVQTLLLFDVVREQEIKQTTAIKTAISHGHFHIVNILANQLPYENLIDIAHYALDEKNYQEPKMMFAVIVVLSNLNNADKFISLPLLAKALITANKKKQYKLASVLMRDLHFYLEQLTDDFNKGPNLILLKENTQTWKSSFAKYLEQHLFTNNAILPMQMHFLYNWGLWISLSKSFAKIEPSTTLPVTLSREDLKGFSFHLCSIPRIHDALNVLLIIAKKYKAKSFEEAQFGMCGNLMLFHLHKHENPFINLTYIVNAFLNLIESGSQEVFVCHSQYALIHYEILDLLNEKGLNPFKEAHEIELIRNWMWALKEVVKITNFSWLKYILWETGAHLIDKVHNKTRNDNAMKAACLYGSAIAMLEFNHNNLETSLKQFEQLRLFLIEILQPSPSLVFLIEKFAACTRAHAHVYMKFTPCKQQESDEIYQNGIKLLKEKIPTFELKDQEKNLVDRCLALLIFEYANQNNLQGKKLAAKSLALEALELFEKTNPITPADQLIYARYHFNIAPFYLDSLEEIPLSINHLKKAVELCSSMKSEPQTLHLYRSSLAHQLYSYGTKIYKEQQNKQKATDLLLEASRYFEEFKLEHRDKLNKDDMALSIRIYGQLLAFDRHCPKKLNILEKIVNDFFIIIANEESYLKEYILGCLQLGNTLLCINNFEKAYFYFDQAIFYNPLRKLLEQPETDIQLSIEDKNALLYLAESYRQLVYTMQCQPATEFEILLNAKRYLTNALLCLKLLGKSHAAMEQVKLKENLSSLLLDIQKKTTFQKTIKFAIELKEKQQQNSTKKKAIPPQNYKKNPTSPPTKKPEEHKIDPLTMEANQLKDLYNTLRKQALELIDNQKQQEEFVSDFPYFNINETNLTYINGRIDALQIKFKELKQQTQLLQPLSHPTQTPKVKNKTRPKKKKVKNKKKKALQVANKHEILQKRAEEQKRTPPLAPKKAPPTPEELREKTLAKLKEQQEEAAQHELKRQQASQAAEELKQQQKEQALRRQQTEEKLELIHLENEQRLKDSKHFKKLNFFTKQQTEQNKPRFDSALFGSYDYTDMLGLSIFRQQIAPDELQRLESSEPGKIENNKR